MTMREVAIRGIKRIPLESTWKPESGILYIATGTKGDAFLPTVCVEVNGSTQEFRWITAGQLVFRIPDESVDGEAPTP